MGAPRAAANLNRRPRCRPAFARFPVARHFPEIPMTSAGDFAPTSQPQDLEPQILLFAPYCGGVAYRHLLEPAVAQLLQGSWTGMRPIADGRSHRFIFSWQGVSAPPPARAVLTEPKWVGDG